MNGKGSKRRPRKVSQKDYDLNWDRIFRPNAEAIRKAWEELAAPPLCDWPMATNCKK